MSIVDLITFLLGFINVALIVRRNIWNYPFGIVLVTVLSWTFFQSKLYSDALLQIFFVAVNFYGWWYWYRSAEKDGDILVARMDNRSRSLWLLGCAVATAGWGSVMHLYTDAALPWWDASVAMMSVAAQILMSRRFIENWLLWIVSDIVAIGIYSVRDLWVPAILYTVFLILSVWGLIDWRRAEKAAA